MTSDVSGSTGRGTEGDTGGSHYKYKKRKNSGGSSERIF